LRCDKAGLTTSGSKSELVVRLALYTHKRIEVLAGRLSLEDMKKEELEELASGMGLKSGSDVPNDKESLVTALETSLRA
jgi:hypothetical protein